MSPGVTGPIGVAQPFLTMLIPRPPRWADPLTPGGGVLGKRYLQAPVQMRVSVLLRARLWQRLRLVSSFIVLAVERQMIVVGILR